MTPDEKRDQTVAAIESAGGVVLACEPLADPGNVHTVVAYRIRAGARSLAVLQAVQAVQADTEISDSGLVAWQPRPMDDEGGDVL